MISVKRILHSIVNFFKRKKLVSQVIKSMVFTALLTILLGGLIYVQVNLFIHPNNFEQIHKEENRLFRSTNVTETDRHLLLEMKEIQDEETNLHKFLKQVEKFINDMKNFFSG